MAINARVRSLIENGHVHSVILAGGFGSRLGAITNQINRWRVGKPAVPIGNLRNIEFAARALTDINVNHVHYLTCIEKESVRDVMQQSELVYRGRVTFEETPEKEPLDTAGAVARLVHEGDWINDTEGIVIVHSADVVYNAEIGRMLENHVENVVRHKAAVTMALNVVPWNEHIVRFGTAQLPGMPERHTFERDDEFFQALTNWYQRLMDKDERCHQILAFGEKLKLRRDMSAPEENRFDGLALSNLNNSSVYIMSTSLFKALLPYFTKKDTPEPLIPDLVDERDPLMMEAIRRTLWRDKDGKPLMQMDSKGKLKFDEKNNPIPIPESFSDWSKHVFKFLTATEEMRRQYPIYSHLLPESSNWRDAGTTIEILDANLDVLHGVLKTGLKEGGFFKELPNNVFVSSNAHIDPSAKLENVIVEDWARIGAGVNLKDCVVGRHVRIGQNVVAKETVFMQKHRDNTQEFVFIEPNQILDRSVVAGCNVKADSNNNRFDSVKIYENKDKEQVEEDITVEKIPEPPKS